MTTKDSVRTIYGALAMSASRWGTPLRILPNSTLNQKFNIRPDDRPYENEVVTTKYLTVGLKGVDIQLQSNGLYLTNFRHYPPYQAALFQHVPLVMRRLTEALTPDESRNLRLRSVQDYNGVLYELWWARVLEDDGTPAIAEKRTLVNGSLTPVTWEPPLSALNPVPTSLNVNEPTTTGSVHLASSRKIKVNFTPQDIQEIISAVNIIYGDPNFADLTEFALCSGVDRQVPGDFNGIQRNYTEAVHCQVTDFLRSRIFCPDSLGGKELVIDAGVTEPLLIGE